MSKVHEKESLYLGKQPSSLLEGRKVTLVRKNDVVKNLPNSIHDVIDYNEIKESKSTSTQKIMLEIQERKSNRSESQNISKSNTSKSNAIEEELKVSNMKYNTSLIVKDSKLFSSLEMADHKMKRNYLEYKEKILQLETIEGGQLPAGIIITITPTGLIGSKRPIQDGNFYFGTKTGAVVRNVMYRAKIKLMITSYPRRIIHMMDNAIFS